MKLRLSTDLDALHILTPASGWHTPHTSRHWVCWSTGRATEGRITFTDNQCIWTCGYYLTPWSLSKFNMNEFTADSIHSCFTVTLDLFIFTGLSCRVDLTIVPLVSVTSESNLAREERVSIRLWILKSLASLIQTTIHLGSRGKHYSSIFL